MFVVFDKVPDGGLRVLDTSDNVVEVVYPEALRSVKALGHKVVFSKYPDFLEDLNDFLVGKVKSGVESTNELATLYDIQSKLDVDSVKLLEDGSNRGKILAYPYKYMGVIIFLTYSADLKSLHLFAMLADIHNKTTFKMYDFQEVQEYAKERDLDEVSYNIEFYCEEDGVHLRFSIWEELFYHTWHYTFTGTLKSCKLSEGVE